MKTEGVIMDYKESLLLPKTEFPMRGNLPNNEPIKYKQWDEKKVYDKMKKNFGYHFLMINSPMLLAHRK